MIYLLFVGLQQFRGNLMSNLGLYYILPAKLTCVTSYLFCTGKGSPWKSVLVICKQMNISDLCKDKK